jgi:hypothetical protein
MIGIHAFFEQFSRLEFPIRTREDGYQNLNFLGNQTHRYHGLANPHLLTRFSSLLLPFVEGVPVLS